MKLGFRSLGLLSEHPAAQRKANAARLLDKRVQVFCGLQVTFWAYGLAS